MRASRINNRAEGVTSLLIYNDGSFAQLLEGPRQSVLDTYKRILSDSRHSAASVIFQEETNHRITEGWDMALLPASRITADGDYDFMSVAAFQASPQYEAAIAHPKLRAFLASFKVMAKTPAAQEKEALSNDALISATAKRFLKIYGSSRRFTRFLPIPECGKPANDVHRPDCGGSKHRDGSA